MHPQRLLIKNIFLIAVSVALLSACSSVNNITLRVTNPAPVGIPASVKKVGILDNSQNKPGQADSRIISFNAKGLKRDGISEELNGVQSELMQAKRFDSIKQISGLLKDTTTGAYADFQDMDWDKMEQLCIHNNVDILFVLELYEIDSRLSVSTNMGFGRGGLNYIGTGGDMNTQLVSGWRIYDPEAKVVVDEYNFSQAFNFGASDINPFSAVVGVISSNEAVKGMSNKAGRFYAKRVIPTNGEETRDYYVRGSDKLKEAKRYIAKGDWTNASNLWQTETTNPDSKIAGRACFNLALANEINKQYDMAIDWANQAYTKLNNRKAWEYIEILKDRQRKERILKDLESK